MMVFKRAVLFLIVLYVAVGIVQSLQAQASEDKMKAVFLYSFVKYTEWGHTDDITIGIYGDPTILEILQKDLPNKKVQGKEVKVKQINSPAEVSACQVVYLPKDNSSQLSKVADASDKKPVLIVTEENLASKGASISFMKQGTKLGFILNKKVLESHKLKVVSTLYNLGKVI